MTALQYKILPYRTSFKVIWGDRQKFGPDTLSACLDFLDQNKTSLKAKARRCMNCRLYFMSDHAGNRRCEQCKQRDDTVYEGIV